MDPDVNELLELRNITKKFPGVTALDSVSLTVCRGSVHALMGENGAGKSTLMKILNGIYRPDSGDILLEGKKIVFSSVRDAMDSGISMIHQELMPVPELTIAENIFLGKEPRSGKSGFINFRKLNSMAADILQRIQLNIPPERKMKDLPIAQIQMIEIAKAISNNARVIIMDEPTSAITSREVDILFGIIDQLKRDGLAVIYISHKMDEIFRISDRITVMRDGKIVDTRNSNELNHDQLISMMVGRSLTSLFDRDENKILGKRVLKVENLRGSNFQNIGFELKEGEILGFAGLMGSGRSEVVNAIYGLEKAKEGSITVGNNFFKINSPRDALNCGIALVTEDRKKNGLVLTSSVLENMTLSSLKKISSWFFVNRKKEAKVVNEEISRYRIVVQNERATVYNLSGGNQQKIVIAKALLTRPKVLILDEPTRGIDVGAKAEIYKMIRELSSGGMAIILISSELTEIIGICDRVLVLNKGHISEELAAREMSEERILRYAMN